MQNNNWIPFSQSTIGKNIGNMGNAIGNAVGNYFTKPTIASPVPGQNMPSQFQDNLGQIGRSIGGAIGGLDHFVGGLIPPAPSNNVPIQHPATPFIQHAQQRFSTPRPMATPTPTMTSVNTFTSSTTPPMGSAIPNTTIRPNITIPYSHGGQYTLPAPMAQILMNAFDDIGQATNSAKILNHPKQITAIGNEQNQNINTVPNYGENASFRTSNLDVPNKDGSIDRGLFRINSNTFQGLYENPTTRQKMAQYGITSWDDINDPQKNAYMARLIYENGGWGRWFAGQQQLRTQGAPNRLIVVK